MTNTPPQWESRAERRARKRLERKQGPGPKKFSVRWVWMIVGVLLLGGAAWWFIMASGNPKTPTDQASEHRKLLDRCTTDMATVFHIHAHLTVTINGHDASVPADTGITSTCMHSLHTHDSTGIIHIESPKKEDFTLA